VAVTGESGGRGRNPEYEYHEKEKKSKRTQAEKITKRGANGAAKKVTKQGQFRHTHGSLLKKQTGTGKKATKKRERS